MAAMSRAMSSAARMAELSRVEEMLDAIDAASASGGSGIVTAPDRDHTVR